MNCIDPRTAPAVPAPHCGKPVSHGMDAATRHLRPQPGPLLDAALRYSADALGAVAAYLGGLQQRCTTARQLRYWMECPYCCTPCTMTEDQQWPDVGRGFCVKCNRRVSRNQLQRFGVLEGGVA